MDIPVTAGLAIAAALLAAFCGWRGSRPPNPHGKPRMVPWRFLMLAFAAGVLMLTVHLVNLLGVKTGR
jgi:drug/metabolite transporter (DMT)-like permease